jgi:hypothetical protein
MVQCDPRPAAIPCGLLYRDALFKAAVPGPVDAVFVGGRPMTRARVPNAGEDPYRPNLLPAVLDQDTLAVEGASWPKDYWKGGTVWGVGKTGIPNITDGFAGKAPDLGCFELGRAPWTPDSTLPRDAWEEKEGW